jgi:hypothetical protein
LKPLKLAKIIMRIEDATQKPTKIF